MKYKFTLFVALLAFCSQAQLQDPDICISYYSPDGMTFDYTGHSYLGYDNNNRLTSEIGVDTINGDSLYKLITTFFNPLHWEQLNYRPDANGKLELKSKYEEERDSAGVLLKAITYDWVNGMWEVQNWSTRYKYTYDSQNRIDECITERYFGGVWEEVNRITYSFSAGFGGTVTYWKKDASNNWERYEKRQYTAFGPIITEEVSSVDASNNETKTEYNTFDPIGSPTVQTHHPDPFRNHFNENPQESTHDRYDANGVLQILEKKIYSTRNDTTLVTTQRHTGGGNYKDSVRTISVKDNKGQGILSANQHWNSSTNMWDFTFGFRNLRTYNGNKETEVTQQQFNTATNQFENFIRNRYKYTRNVGLTEREIVFELSPNPADDLLRLRIDGNQPVQLEIYDGLGRKVLSEQKEPGTSFTSVSQLPSGTYFLKIIREGMELGTEQLIIQ